MAMSFSHSRHFILSFMLSFGLISATAGFSTPVQAADKAIQAVLKGNKAQARAIMSRRTIWGHFRAMDRNNDWNLSLKEMNFYFMTMHKAFDANSNGIVSVHEAPPIMMRYTVSGEPFPPQGLTQPTLKNRLSRLFRILDKNRNGRLSVAELT